MKLRRLALWTAVGLAGLGGCVTTGDATYDRRAITVQSLSLFNQRTSSSLAKRSWKGDWLFRRERLEAIDRGLRQTQPDLVILQEAMAKKDSPSESDRNILGQGALEGYQWDVVKVKEYQDTEENQYHAVAVGLPLYIQPIDQRQRRSFNVGVDGYLTYSVVELEDQPFLVFVVQMPVGNEGVELWYRFIKERVEGVLASGRYCAKRIIIAGYLPGNVASKRFQALIDGLQLKDAAEGHCEVASDCFTGTPLNDLFMATAGGRTPAQMDRIFVHQSAIVSSSRPLFDKPEPTTEYGKLYGLTRLWPTQRFGWGATVRMARCPAKSS